jgi:predicted RNA binding protein YcfA (HicA-like mRNA interferase family)
MSRLPRLTDREVLRLLQKAGFQIHHIRGSHHVLKHPQTGRRTTVPVHGETLAPKTLLSILVSADISVKELSRLSRGKR